jgi:hypothetical protein
MRLAAEHALLVRGRAAGMSVEKLVARTRTSTPAACLSFLTVRPRVRVVCHARGARLPLFRRAQFHAGTALISSAGSLGRQAHGLAHPDPAASSGFRHPRLQTAARKCIDGVRAPAGEQIRCCCPVGSGSAALGGIAARSFHRRISVGAGHTQPPPKIAKRVRLSWTFTPY